MTTTLYTALVPGWRQVLDAVTALLDKAEAWQGGDLLGARLAPDMLPLAYQFRAVVAHSQGAIEAAQAGRFVPDRSAFPETFPPIRARLGEASAMLAALDPAAVDALEGQDMVLQIGEQAIPFRTPDFLLTFSLPNFYFHATTAYDILRAQGLAIGKRDFLGRLKTAP